MTSEANESVREQLRRESIEKALSQGQRPEISEEHREQFAKFLQKKHAAKRAKRRGWS